MKIQKVERQLNLIIALFSTSKALTTHEIRNNVYGYPKNGKYESFLRMFERDKNELKIIGIPITLIENSSGDKAYLINKSEFNLPKITLNEKEALILSLALEYLTNIKTINGNEKLLKQKLFSSGLTDILKQNSEDIENLVSFSSRFQSQNLDNLSIIIDSIKLKQPIRFNYKNSKELVPSLRVVSPYDIFSEYKNWYLNSYDNDKKKLRTFKLNRIIGNIEIAKNTNFIEKIEKDKFKSENETINFSLELKKNDRARNNFIYKKSTLINKKITNGEKYDILKFENIEYQFALNQILLLDTYFKIIDNDKLILEIKNLVDKYLEEAIQMYEKYNLKK